MLELPRSTFYNKRIPKQMFYDNLQITPALKKSFVEQIDSIHWRNKISPETSNLAQGQKVKELQVFSIALNNGTLDEEVLKQIDKMIPYHILFLLEYDGKVQAWIGYKEETGSGAATFKVNQYYYTDWVRPEDLLIKLDGLNLDTVYENLVRQIAGEVLKSEKVSTLQESYEKSIQRNKLMKQIAALEKKAWSEKQPRRKLELLQQIQNCKNELEGIGL